MLEEGNGKEEHSNILYHTEHQAGCLMSVEDGTVFSNLVIRRRRHLLFCHL